MLTALQPPVSANSLSSWYKYGIVILFAGFLSLTSVQAQMISGTVYCDYNANDTYQSIPASGTHGEPGVAGITVIIPTTANSLMTITIALTQAISFAL